MPADQRLAAHLQQRFGYGVGQRTHALAAAGGHDHGFDGCRGHGGSLTGGREVLMQNARRLKSESLPMIPPEIHAEIMKRLAATEREHGVRILMAIESGSRAWGFASPNSDFDVRFIYARPADDYLSLDLEDRRDVIEYPIVDDIDLNGWDLRKALRLFW